MKQVSWRTLALLLLALSAVQAFVSACFYIQLNAYHRLSGDVNVRWSRANVEAFVTPEDQAVKATVMAVTCGRVDPPSEDELLTGLGMLCAWVSSNIRPAQDDLYPMLPGNPSGSLAFINENWQFPNETLALRCGDCEDAALLLLSMIRFYSPRVQACGILVDGSKGAHMAVLISKGGKVAILDPGLYYMSKDELGRLALRDLAAELSKWLPQVEGSVGSGAKVTLLFTESQTVHFRSTNEFAAYFHLSFKRLEAEG